MNAKTHLLGTLLLCGFLVIVCIAFAGCVSENHEVHQRVWYASAEDFAESISSGIEPTDPAVRALALIAIKPEHVGKFNIDQVCDIHEYLYEHWTYADDPIDLPEYFAKASESARTMKGDCDDFAILMASCIEAIGGNARVILARNINDDGHAYAEVFLSNNKETANKLIETVSKRYGGSPVLGHWSPQQFKGVQYWLNLDWTNSHPGGDYFASAGKVVIIYPNGNYKIESFMLN